MAKRKNSPKRKASPSPKKSRVSKKSQAKSQKKSKPQKKDTPDYVQSKTPKKLPAPLRPLKPSAKLKKAQKAAPSAAPKKQRNYLKTRTYKKFAKQYKRKADKDYWKNIQKEFKTLYDNKGQPIRVVMININKKFVHNPKERLKETNRKYLGKEKWRRGKDGKWKEGKVKLRNMYRDKLLGNYLKGRKVGVRFLKVMEKDLVRKYMKKNRIKNFNKAKKKFWKETEEKSIWSIVQLYGGS